MPPFPKPRFEYQYDLDRELAALRTYRRKKPGRQIPRKASDRVLIGTWNIANLGVQNRLESDYALIAEMIGWFDLVAVQEVNDNLRGIDAIHSKLPARYDLLFSDASGNQERQAFLFDTRKITSLFFKDLWESRPGAPFLSYLRYHISDHRPLWAEFQTT